MRKIFSGSNSDGFSLVEVLTALCIVSIVIASMPSLIGITSKLTFDSNDKKRSLEKLVCYVNGFEDSDAVDEDLSSDEISFIIAGEENSIQIENKSYSLKGQPTKKLVTFNKY